MTYIFMKFFSCIRYSSEKHWDIIYCIIFLLCPILQKLIWFVTKVYSQWDSGSTQAKGCIWFSSHAIYLVGTSWLGKDQSLGHNWVTFFWLKPKSWTDLNLHIFAKKLNLYMIIKVCPRPVRCVLGLFYIKSSKVTIVFNNKVFSSISGICR